jgi:LacI family transcriptional regulator
MMKITVHDVAAHAGVSASTVSRVLNRNHDISADTVALVESAVAELGYSRAATKRGRRATRSGQAPLTASLAFLIPDTNIEAMLTPLTGQLMHGIEAVARERGFNLLLTRLAERGGLPPCLTPVQVKGLIVRSGATEKLQRTLPDVPTVWIFKGKNAPLRGDVVQPDNQAIGQMAARYLLERGHRKIAVWNARPGHAEAEIRAQSFLEAARDTGAKVEVATGAEAVKYLKRQKRSGLFLPLGDDATESVYRALQSSGAAVEIISCNNDVPRLRALDARLPNINIRAEEIGHVAAETLLWRLENPHDHRRTVFVEPRLMSVE